MKKLIFALCVCAGLCACSSDDDLVSSTSTSENLGEATAFLRVNLKDVNSLTRATDGGFKYGSADEQTVNNAYFYFYGSDGHAMAKGSVVDGITGTASEEATTPGNIEWESETVVAIWGLNEEHFPTQMLTILNKPADIDLSGLTLENATKVLAGTPYADASGNFVMSTSTYLDGTTSAIVNTTALTNDNFATEPIDLTNDYGTSNPAVDVYVERLAAKVTANDGIEYSGNTVSVDGNSYNAVEITENIPNIASSDIKGIAVRLVGWDVNGVARDAYLSKQIDSSWTTSTPWSSWNDVNDYRCYWAESPNYGVETTYPSSSNGNTDDDEAGTGTQSPLNSYLKYTSLNNANNFTDGYAYCGENTNTTDVLSDDSNTGITNLLVRAQALTQDAEGDWHGSDLVEYQEKLYTAADFCQMSVDDVVAYDFNVLVDEVIDGLKEKYTTLSSYLDLLNDAIIKDHIYVSTTAEDGKHKFSGTDKDTAPTSVTAFDGSLLSLYNVKDGNVRMFYNGAQPYWGEDGTAENGTAVEPDLYAKYPESDIVYGGADLDKYDFWFHVDASKLEGLEAIMGIAGLIVTINDQSYMPIDNSFSFTSSAWDPEDTTHTGSHIYTIRNYFLRAITVEADDIDSDFGSYYPNLYANGYMYYSVPIEHLATNNTQNAIVEGEYGIVRNHWYDITVNSITTLGRGIAKPTEVIIPQPELTYYYLGADINILSWKMVQQTVGW